MYQGMVETIVSRAALRDDGHRRRWPAATPPSAPSTPPAPRRATSTRRVARRGAGARRDGLLPLFAIPTEFGSLAPTQLVIGAAELGRHPLHDAIDTPADNAYVYTDGARPAGRRDRGVGWTVADRTTDGRR